MSQHPFLPARYQAHLLILSPQTINLEETYNSYLGEVVARLTSTYKEEKTTKTKFYRTTWNHKQEHSN